MTYKTSIMSLDKISERLRWWRKRPNIRSIEARVNDCNGWLIIKFQPKLTQAQMNAKLIKSLPNGSLEAKRLKMDMVINQIKAEQE